MSELNALKKRVFDFMKIENIRDTNNQRFLSVVKRELKYIGMIFVLSLIIFKIAFYKENLVVLFRSVLSIFWIFVLAGYFILLYWKEKLSFIERFIIGIVLSAAIIGVFSYYLGLIGLNIKYHVIVLPLILILLGILINFSKNNK